MSALVVARPRRPISTSDSETRTHLVAELVDDQLGGVGVDGLVLRRHHALAHQRLDHVGAALGHAVGELLDGDRLGDDDVAHDLLLLWLRMRWRSRSRARRTEASERIRSPASSSSARETVSLPVRRRWSSRRTGVAGRFSPGGGRRAAAAVSSSSSAGRHLAGGRERRDLGGGRLAGALGDLAARFLLLAPVFFVLGRAVSRPPRRASSPLLPRSRRRASSSARSRASMARAPPPGAGVRPRRARRGVAILVGLARVLEDADAGRLLFGGQRARNTERAARRLGGRRGSGGGRLGAGNGRLRRLGGRLGRAPPGATTRFLRTSTVTAFERPCGKLGAPGRSRPVGAARASRRRSVKGRFCSCSLASCSFVSVMRFGTIILCGRPGRRTSAPASARGPRTRQPRQSSNRRRHSFRAATAA